MRPKQGFFRRLSSVGNFDVPKHSGLGDVVFDPHQSIRTALFPAYSDGIVILLSILHMVSYVYFLYSVFGLASLECVTLTTFFAKTLPGAVLIQFFWSAKSTYLLDKAVLDDKPTGNYVARLLRSTVLTLPFSYIPSWIIGCLCWPLIPIRLYGSAKFYDHSIVIGHYVQASLLYVGGRNDSFSNNLDAFCDIANTSRSRYWDIFEESAAFDISLMLLLTLPCWLGYKFIDLDLERIEQFVGIGVTQDGFWLFLFIVLSCLAFNIIHTVAITAVSILEFSRTTRQVAIQEELPPASPFRWATYIPHMAIGALVFVMLAVIAAPSGLNFRCNRPVVRFEAPFNTSSPTTTP